MSSLIHSIRAVGLGVFVFAGFVAGAAPAHATGDGVTSLSDVPFATDPGFPLTGRREIIVGGVSSGATAVVELASGGDVALAGVINGVVYLQRVTNAGQRGTWPAGNPSTPALVRFDPPAGIGFRSVTDMKVFGDRLYVLANRQQSTTVTTNDVFVLVFGLDGAFRSYYLAMSNFRDEYGAGMAIYQTLVIGGSSTTYVSVIGHRVLDAIESNPFLTRARLEGEELVRDTSIGDTNGYVQVPVPGGLCAPFNEACSMEVSKIVVKPTGVIGTTPVLYVGGAIRTSGDDWDYGLLCMSASGTPCAGFGNGGFVRRAFNNGGSLVDRATGIAVRRFGTFGAYTYTVYLSGNVARRCQAGIGVLAFDGADGSTEFTFGLLGRVLVGGHDGGSGGTPICFLNDGPDITEDAALSGNHLFVAGARVYRDFNGNAYSDVQSLVLDTSGLVVDPLRAHVPGYPPGYTVPADLSSAVRAVTTDAAGRFLVGGQTVGPTEPFPSAFMSGRFVQDRIFGSGFD